MEPISTAIIKKLGLTSTDLAFLNANPDTLVFNAQGFRTDFRNTKKYRIFTEGGFA